MKIVYNINPTSRPGIKMLVNSLLLSSNFADSLKTIYLKRISNTVKRLNSCCERNNYSLNRVEFAFLAAFVICEIEIYNQAKLDPQGFNYTFSEEWTEYIENLQSLRLCTRYFKKEALSLQPILEELRKSLVYFPKEQWSDFLSQDSIIEYFLKVFSVLVPTSMADAFSVPLTVFTNFPKGFSWGDTKNPWLTIYKDICCSNSSGDIITVYIYETEDMIRVQSILSQDNQKKIMLYAQSKELLLKEIQTIKTWTRKVEPSKVYPETIIIQEQQSIRTPLQVLLHEHVQKQSCTSYLENWYSVDASPILPQRVLSIYGHNPYNSNCHGAALYTLGITTIPRFFALPFENPYFDKIMEPVMDGYLESGDMIHLICKNPSIGGMHSFIYISPNLVIQMSGLCLPYQMHSLRDVFLCYNNNDLYTCFRGPFKNDFKTDIDYEHISITEILKQSLKIYRKRKDAPCLYNQSIINVTQTINALFVNYPDLNCIDYKNKTDFKSDSKYQELQAAYTLLLKESEHNTAVRMDIDAMNKLMPNQLSNLMNSTVAFFSRKKQGSDNYLKFKSQSIESGDMIHLIYKNPSIGGMHSLRDVFLCYNNDDLYTCFRGLFKNDFKTDIDYEHISITEILKQPLKIYRKRKDAPCLYNQSIINVTQTINALFVNYRDLNCIDYKNKTDFKSDSKYQELQAAYTLLLRESEHNTAVRMDIDAMNKLMPNQLSNLINSTVAFFSRKKQGSDNYLEFKSQSIESDSIDFQID